MGYQGPPGRKVMENDCSMILYLIVILLFKGDRGIKGEPGYIQKVDFNSTHIVMVGSPGLPGPKVKITFRIFFFFYLYIFQGRIGLPGQPGYNGEKGDRGDFGPPVIIYIYTYRNNRKANFKITNHMFFILFLGNDRTKRRYRTSWI